MHSLHILDASGDETLDWEPGDKQSVSRARRRFKKLKAQGYRFFEVVENKGKEITTFTSSLGKVIASPPMASGPVATIIS